MKTIDDYQKEWGFSNPKHLVSTQTSTLYIVDYQGQKAVFKYYTDIGQKDEADGAPFMALFNGNGFVSVHRYDDGACLLDYIDGDDARSLVIAGKDDDATRVIGQVLNKIHALPVPNHHQFQTLPEYAQELFKYADGDCPDIIKRAAQMARPMLDHQQNICLLHGDMHHENVREHSEKGWLGLDPKGVIGDRAFDCANTLHNPLEMPELTENKDRLLRQAHILSDETGIDMDRIIDYAFIHGCLSSCWWKNSTGKHSEGRLKTSHILEDIINERRAPNANRNYRT